MADDGELGFLVEIDVRAEAAKQAFEDLGKQAQAVGRDIDKVFDEVSRSIGVDIENLDINTKLIAISTSFHNAEANARALEVQIGKIADKAELAKASGDIKGYQQLSEELVRIQKKYVDAQAQAAKFNTVLKELDPTIKKLENAKPVRFFDSQDEYNKAKKLEEEINELKDRIAEVMSSDKWDADVLTMMQDNLIDLQTQLDLCNAKAEVAAALLGDKLGSAAAEVSTNVYELNAALEQQESIYNSLNEELDKTAALMKEAEESGDAELLAVLQQKYLVLSESVSKAGTQLANLKARQKDATQGWESISKSLNDNAKPLKQTFTSVRQLSSALSGATSPVGIFRAALNVMTGGLNLSQISIKGLITSFKALTKALLSNPFTAVAVAILAVVVAMAKMIQSIEKAEDRQKRLNAEEKNYLELLQFKSQLHKERVDDMIKPRERELQIMKEQYETLKAQDAPMSKQQEALEKIRKKEDEINKLRANAASKRAGYYADEIANIENNRKKLDNLHEQLRKALDAQGRRDKKFTVDIDGRKTKAKIDKALEIIKGQIENTEMKINLGVTARDENKDTQNELSKVEEQRKKEDKERAKQAAENAKQRANTERSILRAEQQARLALIDDEYEKELKTLQTNAKNKKDDLQRRLKEEKNLTAAARESINKQIKLNEEQLQKDLLELDKKWVQRRLAVEKEALNLKLAIVEKGGNDELNLRLQLLKKEEQAELEANKAKPEDKRLSEKDIRSKYVKAEKDLLDEYISKYRTYLQERQKLDEEYWLNYAALYEDGQIVRDDNGNITGATGTKFRQGVTQENVNELERQRNDTMAALDEEVASRYKEYQQWCYEIANMTLLQLEGLLKYSQDALKALEKQSNVDQNQLAIARAEVKKLEDAVKKAKLTPRDAVREEWVKFAQTIGDGGQVLSELGQEMDGFAGKVLEHLGNIITDVSDVIIKISALGQNSVEQMTKTTQNAMEGMSDASKTASKAMQAASNAVAILAIIQAIYTLVNELKNLLDDIIEEQGENEFLTFLSDFLHYITDAETMLEQFLWALLGPIGTIAGLLTTTEKASDRRKIEKNIEALTKANEKLKQSQDDVARSAEELYGKDKQDAIKRQIELVNEQIANTQKQIDEEKKLKKADEDKIKDWESQIHDLQNTIADLGKAAEEAIFGSSIESSIESLASGLEEAWQSSETASMKASDFAKKMMKDDVNEAIKSYIQGTGQMQKIRAQLEAFMSDDFLSQEEQARLTAMSQEFMNDVNEKFAWAENLFNSENGRNAQAQGIATASQESVDEFNGRMTAVQGHTFNISENSNILRETVEAIYGSVQRIEQNTQRINDVYNVVASMQRNGITINTAN